MSNDLKSILDPQYKTMTLDPERNLVRGIETSRYGNPADIFYRICHDLISRPGRHRLLIPLFASTQLLTFPFRNVHTKSPPKTQYTEQIRPGIQQAFPSNMLGFEFSIGQNHVATRMRPRLLGTKECKQTLKTKNVLLSLRWQHSRQRYHLEPRPKLRDQ